MKLGRILNKKLNTAIADMGHGDMLVICDAGFPIPSEAQRIDLAIEQDLPYNRAAHGAHPERFFAMSA